MVAEAIVSYPAYIMLFLSYRRKNYDASYKLIILVIVRFLLGFLNPPREEVGVNLEGRLALKWMVQLTATNYSINLACQIYEKNVHKILILVLSYLYVCPVIIYTTF